MAANAVEQPADRLADREFLRLVPHEYARRHLVLLTTDGVEPCLCAAPSSPVWACLNVERRLDRSFPRSIEDPERLATAIDRAYLSQERERTDDEPAVALDADAVDLEAQLSSAMREVERDLLVTQGKAAAVRLVDLVLFEAITRGASDVHVQPTRERTLIRYRLDGVLHTVRELPLSMAASVISRLKIMARLDVAEQRAPQDGRATVTVGGSATGDAAVPGKQPRRGSAGRRIDLRVSTLPSTYGERVVLRLLDQSRSEHLLSFAALGMPEAIQARFLQQAARSSGIVLSTGPTGSGKTTTLYTTIAWINATNAGGSARGCEFNIMTIEDPVEFDLSTSGIAASQTQVDPKKNVTFATGLRHILRQDPDVIMVGEIRDEETAKIAVQASLTGHLVLSTLHTNDAASAVVRLVDLGVEPYLVASSLSAVLAQRLTRKTHADCGGRGCPGCLDTGFQGRTGLFELLTVDGTLRELITRHCSSAELRAAAQRAGMTTLRQAGLALVDAGTTNMTELSRVIEAEEEQSS